MWRKLIYDPFNAIEQVSFLGENTEGISWLQEIYDPFNAIEQVSFLGENTEGISWLQEATTLEANFYFILSEYRLKLYEYFYIDSYLNNH